MRELVQLRNRVLRTMIQSDRASTSSILEKLKGGMRRQKDRSSLLSRPLATLRYQLSISKRTIESSPPSFRVPLFTTDLPFLEHLRSSSPP